MEEEWRIWLRENNPEMYKEACRSIAHTIQWRDARIKELEETVCKLTPTEHVKRMKVLYDDLCMDNLGESDL